jgi:hypothetical protein
MRAYSEGFERIRRAGALLAVTHLRHMRDGSIMHQTVGLLSQTLMNVSV